MLRHVSLLLSVLLLARHTGACATHWTTIGVTGNNRLPPAIATETSLGDLWRWVNPNNFSNFMVIRDASPILEGNEAFWASTASSVECSTDGINFVNATVFKFGCTSSHPNVVGDTEGQCAGGWGWLLYFTSAQPGLNVGGPAAYEPTLPHPCPVAGPLTTLQKCMTPTSSPTDAPTTIPIAPPTIAPTNIPSLSPTTFPITAPTNIPSILPTFAPTSGPVVNPTMFPSVIPTMIPSNAPTSSPSVLPTGIPSTSPSNSPTNLPTMFPTKIPSSFPTNIPTILPSAIPSQTPSILPTDSPTSFPSAIPSSSPSIIPTILPTNIPSKLPSSFPTDGPTLIPTILPSDSPSSSPTNVPTKMPLVRPTRSPLTMNQTHPPTSSPSISPSLSPFFFPTSVPSSIPTGTPSNIPSQLPSNIPSQLPSDYPSSMPSRSPSTNPTSLPTRIPSLIPTNSPSSHPSIIPTGIPTILPTVVPSLQPTFFPTSSPTNLPTSNPTKRPTRSPLPGNQTHSPTISPTDTPTISPTDVPSMAPTNVPTFIPTILPTDSPSTSPSDTPSNAPTIIPTNSPTNRPSSHPSAGPTKNPVTSRPKPTNVPSHLPTDFPTNAPSTVPTTAPSGTQVNIPSPPVQNQEIRLVSNSETLQIVYAFLAAIFAILLALLIARFIHLIIHIDGVTKAVGSYQLWVTFIFVFIISHCAVDFISTLVIRETARGSQRRRLQSSLRWDVACISILLFGHVFVLYFIVCQWNNLVFVSNKIIREAVVAGIGKVAVAVHAVLCFTSVMMAVLSHRDTQIVFEFCILMVIFIIFCIDIFMFWSQHLEKSKDWFEKRTPTQHFHDIVNEDVEAVFVKHLNWLTYSVSFLWLLQSCILLFGRGGWVGPVFFLFDFCAILCYFYWFRKLRRHQKHVLKNRLIPKKKNHTRRVVSDTWEEPSPRSLRGESTYDVDYQTLSPNTSREETESIKTDDSVEQRNGHLGLMMRESERGFIETGPRTRVMQVKRDPRMRPHNDSLLKSKGKGRMPQFQMDSGSLHSTSETNNTSPSSRNALKREKWSSNRDVLRNRDDSAAFGKRIRNDIAQVNQYEMDIVAEMNDSFRRRNNIGGLRGSHIEEEPDGPLNDW